jgi:hypothetical protein
LADGDFDKVLGAIATSANAIGSAINYVAYQAAIVRTLFAKENLFKSGKDVNAQIALLKRQFGFVSDVSVTGRNTGGAVQFQKQQLALEKKIQAERKKALEAEKRKQAEALAKKRAGTIFDMENIQIVAALQSKVDGEQRMRLVTMLALNTENYTAAEKLADIVVRLNAPALANLGVMIQAGDTIDDVIKKLITSQAKLAGLQLMAEDFPMPDNIFEEWETSLENILQMLMQMLGLLSGTTPAKMKTGIYSVDAYGFSSPEAYQQYRGGERGDVFSNSQALDYSKLALGGSARGEYSSYTPNMGGGVNVNIQVAGNVTTERDLVTSISNAFYQMQKDGKSILYSSTAI